MRLPGVLPGNEEAVMIAHAQCVESVLCSPGIQELTLDELECVAGGPTFLQLVIRGLDIVGRWMTLAEIADLTSADLAAFGERDFEMSRPGGGI